MQKWEYSTILRFRELKPEKEKNKVGSFYRAEYWCTNTDEGWVYRPLPEYLSEFGEQGWELVTVIPRSSIAGGETNWTGVTQDFAGFTNEELWVFKRPKE